MNLEPLSIGAEAAMTVSGAPDPAELSLPCRDA